MSGNEEVNTSMETGPDIPAGPEQQNTSSTPAGGRTGDALKWKDIKFIPGNGPAVINSETGERIVELFRTQRPPRTQRPLFDEVIEKVYRERFSEGVNANGFSDELKSKKVGIDDVEKLLILLFHDKLFHDKLFHDKEQVRAVPLEDLKKIFQDVFKLENLKYYQCFYRYGDGGKKRSNVFLRIATDDKQPPRPARGHKIIINPFYCPDDPSAILDSEFKDLFPSEQKVAFTVKLCFKSNERVCASLRGKSFAIPVSIDRDGSALKITAGSADGGAVLQFRVGGEAAAKWLEVDLPVAVSGYVEKWKLKKIFIPGPESNSEITFCSTSSVQSASDCQKAFEQIYKNEKYIGQYFFPGERKDILTIEVEESKDFNNRELARELAMLIDSCWIIYPKKFPASAPSPGVLGKMLSASLWISVLWDITNSSSPACNSKFGVFQDPLPESSELVPLRKVDLRPFELKKKFEESGLYYQSSALNSLAMALNSGGHVILTGPPGGGKTELATNLPGMLDTKQDYILCTASPDWTTNELIGRYMPVPGKDSDREAVLDFEPGFFLQAIANDKWLVIDELNRADIDSCMGPLFSVLSGHKVLLPYRTDSRIAGEAAEDEEADPGGASPGGPKPEDKPSSWRRVGICQEADRDLDDDVCWYKVPEDFRIICTMNDSDAGMLNQLSYALQRRFSVIRIEAPMPKQVATVIDDKIKKVCERYSSSEGLSRIFPVDGNKLANFISEPLKKLFASGADDLMQLRIVGFGQVMDIISLVVEGLSCPPGSRFDSRIKEKEKEEEEKENLLFTLLADGVVLKVFPQLPAFARERDRTGTAEKEESGTFSRALKCIASVFKDRKYSEYELEKDRLKIKNTNDDLLSHLEGELYLLFRNQYVNWKDDWDKAKNTEAGDPE